MFRKQTTYLNNPSLFLKNLYKELVINSSSNILFNILIGEKGIFGGIGKNSSKLEVLVFLDLKFSAGPALVWSFDFGTFDKVMDFLISACPDFSEAELVSESVDSSMLIFGPSTSFLSLHNGLFKSWKSIGAIHKIRQNILGGKGVSNSDVARYLKVEVRSIRVKFLTWRRGVLRTAKKISKVSYEWSLL